MYTYITIELLIIATGVIIFVVGFCGFLQKWMQYVQELDEHGNKGNKQDVEKGKTPSAKLSKCVLHSNCSSNDANGSNPPSYTIDLPPNYDEVMKNAQQQPQNAASKSNEQILQVQQLPQVHTISETMVKSSGYIQIV